jgi:hypothetical protein
MSDNQEYVSRKKKLLKDIESLSLCTLDKGFKGFAVSSSTKMSSILSRFDLGGVIDEESTELLDFLESELSKDKPDTKLAYTKFVKLVCQIFESVISVRDFG